MLKNSYNFFLNSTNRSSGTLSNFQIFLKNPLTLTSVDTAFYISIKSAEIPYSFFALTSSFNTLNISVDETPYVLNIPPGNYNSINLNTLLISLIQPYITHATFNIDYNRSNGFNTITLSNYDNTPFNMQINFNQNLKLGQFFGYTKQVSIVCLAVIVYTNNISDIYSNCGQIQTLFIRSNTLSQSGSYENLNSSLITSNIIQKIIVDRPPNSMIFYLNELFNNVKLNEKIISALDFYITSNISNDPIDFNGLSFSLRVSIDELIVNNTNELLEPSEEIKNFNNIDDQLYNDIMNT